jgi:tetratricopeptide (TPR) repeat protein
MGRKRTRAWKYILFCLTGLSFLILLNCATIQDIKQRFDAREHLHRGQQLLDQKDFEGALGEYQKVLSLPSCRPEKAEALFNMGLIYVHFGYAKKDYGESLDLFAKILNEYPESPLVEQAKIWVGVLQEHDKLSRAIRRLGRVKRNDTKIEEPVAAREYLLRAQTLLARGDYEGSINENQKVLSMSTRRSPEDEALLNLGLIHAHPGNPKKDYGKSLEFFKRLIRDYPRSALAEEAKTWVEVLEENEELNWVIQRLKQVDIEVEERKREKAK